MVLLLVGLAPLVAAMGSGDYTSLDAILAEYAEHDGPGVVAYLSVEGRPEVAARGRADLNRGTAVAVGDQFRIGSATKPFVAALVLQLAEEGLLELDAPIARYLPPSLARRIANADTATVEQMLAMTSGVPDYIASGAFDEQVQRNPSRPWTPTEVLAFIHDEPASFEPGSDYEYSNSNYILAQLIIESRLGMSLQEALDERMFRPLGLSQTFLEMPGRFAEGIVRGYEDHGDWVDVTRVNDGVGLGDGGIVSTAAELARLAEALWNGVILSEASRNRMMREVRDNYGLGIGVDRSPFGRLYSHAGATSGFQSVFVLVPSRDAVLVVLTNNFDSEALEDIVYAMLAYAL